MRRTSIDINSDLGESFGAYTLGDDGEVLRHISSANVACGFHAGDPHVMRRTVALAGQHGVRVGAHPGLPDLLGFGRRRMAVSAEELHDFCLYQVGALKAFAEAAGWMECRPVAEAAVAGADHVLVIGRVDAAGGRAETAPAVHLRRNGLKY